MKKDNEPKAPPEKPPILAADVPTVAIMAAIFATSSNQYSPEQAAIVAANQFVCVKLQQAQAQAKWEEQQA